MPTASRQTAIRTAQNRNLFRSIFYAHLIEYRRFRETGVKKSDEGMSAYGLNRIRALEDRTTEHKFRTGT